MTKIIGLKNDFAVYEFDNSDQPESIVQIVGDTYDDGTNKFIANFNEWKQYILAPTGAIGPEPLYCDSPSGLGHTIDLLHDNQAAFKYYSAARVATVIGQVYDKLKTTLPNINPFLTVEETLLYTLYSQITEHSDNFTNIVDRLTNTILKDQELVSNLTI